jgi:hypothetical protein
MRLTLFLAALLAIACPAASASAAVVTLGASKDNTLYEDPDGTLSNALGPHFYVGKTGTKGFERLRRGLVAFDLSAIPAGATVTAATFRLTLSGSGFDKPITVHRVTKNWGEGTSNAGEPGGGGAQATAGDATWIDAVLGTSKWTTPGGDFGATPSLTTAVLFNQAYDFAGPGLTADVQGWVNAPASNFGWIVRGDESLSQSAVRFETREFGVETARPSLTVTYSVPEPGAGAALAAAVVLLNRRRR